MSEQPAGTSRGKTSIARNPAWRSNRLSRAGILALVWMAFVGCAIDPGASHLMDIVGSPAPEAIVAAPAERWTGPMIQITEDDEMPVGAESMHPETIETEHYGTLMVNRGENEIFPSEDGIVSWYGYDHYGRKTANGEWFNPEAMSAAHKSLPFGTLVRVTRGDTGHSVNVIINDRGPYIEGRIVDLSRRAAEQMDLLDKGIAPCELEVIAYPPKARAKRVAGGQATELSGGQ